MFMYCAQYITIHMNLSVHLIKGTIPENILGNWYHPCSYILAECMPYYGCMEEPHRLLVLGKCNDSSSCGYNRAYTLGQTNCFLYINS